MSKWKKDISNQCVHCKQIENIKHLLFECNNVKNIWNTVSNLLSFKIQWKHIVVGFFYEKSDKTKSLNLLITYVAYRIYKQKMLCRLDSMNETECNIYNHVKKIHLFLCLSFTFFKCKCWVQVFWKSVKDDVICLIIIILNILLS